MIELQLTERRGDVFHFAITSTTASDRGLDDPGILRKAFPPELVTELVDRSQARLRAGKAPISTVGSPGL